MRAGQPGRRLSRAAGDGRAASPVRIVHLGLGNFFRAHQAWYTEHAQDGAQWGIAAFAGRAAGITTELAAQDGLYTLLVRGADGDHPEVVSSLSAVHAGDDLGAWRRCVADPAVVIMTSTVTEAGYRRDETGGLDRSDPAVAADLAALRADPVAGAVTTAPGKIVAGLIARRAAAAGPLTLLPCDNVPDNGAALARVVLDLAADLDGDLAAWIADTIAVASTMVDRITPRATAADLAAIADRSGVVDPCLVVTEPFAEWVVSGAFPGGRPRWESAGARFVEDVGPYETRKLWLLNGSHSLLAYAAPLRGHETVADAIADPLVRGWVEDWWDVAARHLPFPAAEVTAYRAALLDRYGNPAIRHLLAQIAADGSQKLPIRIVPALLADRAKGSMPLGATRAVAAWVAHLRGHGAPVSDPAAEQLAELVRGDVEPAVERVTRWLGIEDPEVTAVVLRQYAELTAAD